MTISRRRTTFVRRLSIGAALVAVLRNSPRRDRLRHGGRGAELLQDRRSARRSTTRAQYQAQLRQVGAANAQRADHDAGRRPRARASSAATCARRGDDGCAGDVRLYDWEPKGYGIVEPVLFTARNGATISGHVWATEVGPGQAARHRDHERLGPGAPSSSTGSPRRRSRRPATSCSPPTRRARASPTSAARRPTRTRAPRADRRPPVLRRHARTRSTSSSPRPSSPYVPRPSCETGTSHAAQAEPPRGGRPERRLQPVLEAARTRARSASPATPTAPRASPTSASRTRA